MKTLFVILALLISVPCFAQANRRMMLTKKVAAAAGGGGTNSITVALVGTKTSGGSTTLTTGSGSVTAGRTLVILVNYDTTVTASNPRDSAGNTYRSAGSPVTESANPQAKVMIYYATNVTGGSVTASVDFTADPAGTIYLVQIAGLAAASFDLSADANTDQASPFTMSSGTLGSAPAAVITILQANRNGANPTTYSSSNFSILSQESDWSTFWTSCVAYLIVDATTSLTPSISTGNLADRSSQKLASFKQ